MALPEEHTQFVLVPTYARRNWRRLLGKQAGLLAASETSPYNAFMPENDRTLGVVASGIAYAYLADAFDGAPCPHPVLKVGQYPVPVQGLRRLADACDRILVLEEGAPFIEEMLRAPLCDPARVMGRLDGTVPRHGELSPEIVRRALGRDVPVAAPPDGTVQRPPRLCAGCPHRDTLRYVIAATEAVPGSRVFSDIGCYALGLVPPIDMTATCVNMGSSITMAKGATDAGVRPSVAVIGDSTFAHSGMTGLLDVVEEQSPMTTVILDNAAVAMTGGQDSSGAGRLEQIVIGLGVAPSHVRVVIPVADQHDENVRILREEMAHDGVSVVISRRICVRRAAKRA